MPTDLRAALRDAADELADIAENERIATKQYRGGIADADECDAIAARLRALADAPPTVAELLPMVDATHEVRWTSRSGTLCRCLLDDRGGIRAFAVERQGSSGRWLADLLRPYDLTQPARLVEVTP